MDVIFEPQTGKPFTIEVGFFDTVLEIKEKIQKYHGIPLTKQTLVFNGQVLQDERDIEYCDIFHNSRIRLVVAVSDSDKPQVKTEESLPDSKRNHEVDGGEIQDNRYVVRDSELIDHNNSEVNVNVKPLPTGSGVGPKKLKLMVLPKCGTKKIPIEVNASDNVGELRKELQKMHQKLHFQLPQEGYFFIYKQNVMDDDRSFRWHHVSQGDTIEIFNGSVSGGS